MTAAQRRRRRSLVDRQLQPPWQHSWAWQSACLVTSRCEGMWKGSTAGGASPLGCCTCPRISTTVQGGCSNALWENIGTYEFGMTLHSLGGKLKIHRMFAACASCRTSSETIRLTLPSCQLREAVVKQPGTRQQYFDSKSLCNSLGQVQPSF